MLFIISSSLLFYCNSWKKRTGSLCDRSQKWENYRLIMMKFDICIKHSEVTLMRIRGASASGLFHYVLHELCYIDAARNWAEWWKLLITAANIAVQFPILMSVGLNIRNIMGDKNEWWWCYLTTEFVGFYSGWWEHCCTALSFDLQWLAYPTFYKWIVSS